MLNSDEPLIRKLSYLSSVCFDSTTSDIRVRAPGWSLHYFNEQHVLLSSIC